MFVYLVMETYRDYFGNETTSPVAAFSDVDAAREYIVLWEAHLRKTYPAIANAYTHVVQHVPLDRSMDTL